MKKNFQAIIWGAALIVIGIIISLNIAGITNISLWSYILGGGLIVIGINSVVSERKNLFGYFMALIGALIIIRKIFDISFSLFAYALPVILIIAGVSFIVNIFLSKSNVNPSGSAFVIFSGREDKRFPQDYKGSNITCIFGGYDIDLSTHTFTNDINFNIFTMFGGTDITVPKNVNVIIQPTAIFGAVTNVTDNNNDNEFTVYINGLCVFGGIEINNYKRHK